jgi:hypothetical protein
MMRRIDAGDSSIEGSGPLQAASFRPTSKPIYTKRHGSLVPDMWREFSSIEPNLSPDCRPMERSACFLMATRRCTATRKWRNRLLPRKRYVITIDCKQRL